MFTIIGLYIWSAILGIRTFIMIFNRDPQWMVYLFMCLVLIALADILVHSKKKS